MASTPLWGGSTVHQVTKSFAVFFYWNLLQHSACVSKLFLRWINQWHWTNQWSDSLLLLISLSQSQAPRGLLFGVSLSPCMYGVCSAVVKGRSRTQFSSVASRPVFDRQHSWFWSTNMCISIVKQILTVYESWNVDKNWKQTLAEEEQRRDDGKHTKLAPLLGLEAHRWHNG